MKNVSRLFLASIFFLQGASLLAQPNWNYKGYFNFGCNLNLTYGPSQRFPGVRLYAAFIANGIYKKNLTVNYGPSISIYTKTLGANLNPLAGDLQVDFTNSFSVGGAWGKELPYAKFLKRLTPAHFIISPARRNMAPT